MGRRPGRRAIPSDRDRRDRGDAVRQCRALRTRGVAGVRRRGRPDHVRALRRQRGLPRQPVARDAVPQPAIGHADAVLLEPRRRRGPGRRAHRRLPSPWPTACRWSSTPPTPSSTSWSRPFRRSESGHDSHMARPTRSNRSCSRCGSPVTRARRTLSSLLPFSSRLPSAPRASTQADTAPGIPPQGFDTCAAPSATHLDTWWRSSPFTSVGIYIGGANRGCAQPNLTGLGVDRGGSGLGVAPDLGRPAGAVHAARRDHEDLGRSVLGRDPGSRRRVRRGQRRRGARLRLVGSRLLRHGGVSAWRACSRAVLASRSAGCRRCNDRGYLAGFYSSLCSGILDLAAVCDIPVM